MDFLMSVVNSSSLLGVVLSTVLLSVSTGMIGILAVLGKRSMAADVVSHSMLPGVCLGFLLTSSSDIGVLMSGALVSGAISLTAMHFVLRKGTHKPEVAQAVVLSTFFGFGVVLLSPVLRHHSGEQSGVTHLLFGNLAALTIDDVSFLLPWSIAIVSIIALFRNRLKAYLFDTDFYLATGAKSWPMEFFISGLLISAIGIGIKSAGVVFVSSLLVLPCIAAMQWTYSIQIIMALTILFSCLSALLGVMLSFAYPSLSSGATVVLVNSLIVVISVIFKRK